MGNFTGGGSICVCVRAPMKSFSIMQCIFDQPLSESLKPFHHFLFFLRNGITWIIWHQRNDLNRNVIERLVEKTHQVVWDSLLDYDRLEWQRTLTDLEKVPEVPYQDVLNQFDIVWCVTCLIVTHSNLVVTWKV
jgi:hypothetical protein